MTADLQTKRLAAHRFDSGAGGASRPRLLRTRTPRRVPLFPWHLAAILLLLLFCVASNCLAATPSPAATLYYFWGEGCPHCAQAKPLLEQLQRKYPELRVESWEVLQHRENIPRLMRMARERGREATGVPVFIIGAHYFSGFSRQTPAQLESAVKEALQDRAQHGVPPRAATPRAAERLAIPGVGELDARRSLPYLTLVIAALDSFNPCAFFVLFFLLSLLIHVRSRPRMILIGGVFVAVSGLLYFLFLAAWLNLFLVAGTLPVVTTAAGVLALVIGLVNVKDFFLFRQGITLSIPEGKKPDLFARMRRLLKAESLPALLAGTGVLAVAANSYELLCTAGFPMVFTRALTLHRLPTAAYYGYLALYCLVYVLPLAAIVAIFTATLGGKKLTEWQGRVLKLVSGLMMLGLAGVLLIRPALLNDPALSGLLLAATLALAAVLALCFRPGRR
ncbi:thioredoxin family protein [Geomonas paludis]|uniref:Membrane protein n=1 Tax=Geomonas paludis TaxID=2740185 RepID=A0A6V8MQ52_9BACT|nr:thioredoxin family protein [Geomonas paludis]UPU36202.1 thioredoxin family protein [Geomonas paludis]GFO62186.1 membrane protein [Geomonas paludis]